MASTLYLRKSVAEENLSIDNLERLFLDCPKDIIVDPWYPRARSDIQIAATELDMPWSILAGIVAAISPMKYWNQNIRDAVSIVKHTRYRQSHNLPISPKIPGIGGTDANNQKAIDILQSGDVMAFLSGRKVVNFWENIVGLSDNPTIDSHAALAALGSSNRGSIGFGDATYTLIENAYIDLAVSHSVLPSRLQEIVWVHRKYLLENGSPEDLERYFPNGKLF